MLRLFWGLLFSVSISCISHASAPSTLPNIEAFNANMVSLLKGEASTISSLSKEATFSAAKNTLKNAKKDYRVVAEGKNICRFYFTSRLCWGPVEKSGKIGIQFVGKSEPFFPKSDDIMTWRKDLKSFISASKKKTLFSFVLPSAEAEGLDVGISVNETQISENDTNLILGTMNGWKWYSADPDRIANQIQKWPENYVQNNIASCTPTGAKIMLNRNHEKMEVQQTSEGSYLIKIENKQYKVKVATPKDVQECRTQSFQTDQSCAQVPIPRNMKVESGYDDSGICNFEARACYYPFPQSYLTVQACQDKDCTSVGDLSPLEWGKILDAPSENVSAMSDAMKQIRTLAPEANFQGRNLGIVVRSNMDGSTATQLSNLKATYGKLNGSFFENNSLENFQTDLAQVSLASRCCSSQSCRETVYLRKSIHLAPAENTQPGRQ